LDLKWGDVLAAASLANLAYIRNASLLFGMRGRSAYWLKADPSPPGLVALLLNNLVLGLFFFVLFRGIRRWENAPPNGASRVIRVMAGLVLLAVAVVLIFGFCIFLQSTPLSPWVGLGHPRTLVLAEISGLLLPIAYWTDRKRILRAARLVLILLSPLVVLTFARSIIQISTYDPNYLANRPLASRLAVPRSGPHVVWVVFDEWDAALTFSERPAGLDLPEIDRLRRESFYADQVIPPGPNTDRSMPALTIGKPVSSVEPDGPADLSITFTGGATAHWSTYPTVFSDARKLGFDTGVVAWGLPYCRVLSASLTGCYWDVWNGYDSQNVAHVMRNQLRSLVETQFHSLLGQSLGTQANAWLYHRLFEESKRVVCGQDYNLTLLHLPVPHPPFFYDRRTGRDDYGSNPLPSLRSRGAGYLDALSLVDRSIGDLRRAMEAAGVWDSTTLLLSADHPYRERGLVDGKSVVPRVPFLVKLAGRQGGGTCSVRFSALITKDLLLALLRNEVATAADLNQWILSHRSAFPEM